MSFEQQDVNDIKDIFKHIFVDYSIEELIDTVKKIIKQLRKNNCNEKENEQIRSDLIKIYAYTDLIIDETRKIILRITMEKIY